MPMINVNEAYTDEQLLTGIKSTDTVVRDYAFERLLVKYQKLMWHIARRYFKNDEDAMDVFQEACLKIYKGLAAVTLPENGTLKSWVCGVTSNACLDELRKRKITTAPLPEESDIHYVSDRFTAPSAEDELLAKTRADEILDAIGKLPEDHRNLIILRDMNGLSYQELAEATGTNINTVKSRLSRARDSLYKIINS